MKTRIAYLILGSLILSSNAYAGGSSTVGPANPAAVNCKKLGGKLERVETPAGTDANCVIEEWSLFQAMDQRGLVKHHDYENGSMPNPAAVNCLDIQGTVRLVDTNAGQAGYCVVAQWDLFRAIDVTGE